MRVHSIGFSRLILLIGCIFSLFGGKTMACDMKIEKNQYVQPVFLETLPLGIVAGMLDCGDKRVPVQFWTLAVDPQQSTLGIRDNHLFDLSDTGPLTSLMSAQVDHDFQVNILERTQSAQLSLRDENVKRPAFRRFVTFCDNVEGIDPLNCSVGNARIKARVSAKHVDGDGMPDVSMHEISIYDGDSRLHVLSFITPYSQQAALDVSHWIDAINAVSDVFKPISTSAVR